MRYLVLIGVTLWLLVLVTPAVLAVPVGESDSPNSPSESWAGQSVAESPSISTPSESVFLPGASAGGAGRQGDLEPQEYRVCGASCTKITGLCACAFDPLDCCDGKACAAFNLCEFTGAQKAPQRTNSSSQSSD